MAEILVLNGPNLNLLGRREPQIYGTVTLDEIRARLAARAAAAGHTLAFHQENAEHALVEHVHRAAERGTACAIINPGAYTHTSIALRDAFLGTGLPFIEVHLSNPHAREPFRHRSYLADIALGVIAGLGADGYELALEALIRRLAAGTVHAQQ
ncbi:type II 3-dehydroquinate dehydratase [Inmirania thermothiophila]|uniref:type II 3-dehydroquinate dehydratase n=1 Tax=Inmirania thermothiophila TaxID=1750597 RepID=UPI000F4A99AF|nr:type II 3-dehydroquinate dehydratase [Inmirania thermothiophila]